MANPAEFLGSRSERFEAKIYILEVGSDRKRLYVPETILQKIEWFSKEMDNLDQMATTIGLLSSDSSALSTLLDLVDQGTVPSIAPTGSPTKQGSLRTQLDNQVHRYIGAYIETTRFEMESMENSLIDAILKYYSRALVLPEAVAILIQEDQRGLPLYYLLLGEMAHGIQAGFYNQRQENSSIILDDLKPEHRQALYAWTRADFVTLLAQIGRCTAGKKRNITVATKNGPCVTHTHNNTPLCTSSPMRMLSARPDSKMQKHTEVTSPQTKPPTISAIPAKISISKEKDGPTIDPHENGRELEAPARHHVLKVVKEKSPTKETHDARTTPKDDKMTSAIGERKRKFHETVQGDDSPIWSSVGKRLRAEALSATCQHSSDTIAPSVEAREDGSP